VTYPYDIEMIGALFVIPANHFPIVLGQQTWFYLGRIRDAFQKNQKEKRDGKRERQISALSGKGAGVSRGKNPSVMII